MKLRIITASLFTLVGLFGCANPTFTNQRDDFRPTGWDTIAVMPFGGDARFAQAATQSFTGRLLTVNGFRIMQPSTVEVSISQLGIQPSSNGFTIVEAQQVGKAVDADAVIIGTVTSHNNGITMNGFCTVQLIDVSTGEIVAASQQPSGLLMAYSEHQCVMAAAGRTAKEMQKVLSSLDKKNTPFLAPVGPAVASSKDA